MAKITLSPTFMPRIRTKAEVKNLSLSVLIGSNSDITGMMNENLTEVLRRACGNAPAALLCNLSVRGSSGLPVSYELFDAGFPIRKLFTPEHGISSQSPDGQALDDGRDTYTGLPLISLYGERMKPYAQDLNDVEVVIADLPNIGCRFYTYWWTITLMMEACAEAGKKFVLIDRPNLSGRSQEAVEGPLLDEETCASFLGRWRMPLTFHETYGALVRHFAPRRIKNPDYSIIEVPNAENSAEIFIPPSPGIPTPDTITIYPFTALFEGLNLNNGRGTTHPFFVLGAPWIDAIHFLYAFNDLELPGIRAALYTYVPLWSRYAGVKCEGLFFSITEKTAFRPVFSGIRLMNLLSVLYPAQLQEATYPTHANPAGQGHLNLLLGLAGAFEKLCNGSRLLPQEALSLCRAGKW